MHPDTSVPRDGRAVCVLAESPHLGHVFVSLSWQALQISNKSGSMAQDKYISIGGDVKSKKTGAWLDLWLKDPPFRHTPMDA